MTHAGSNALIDRLDAALAALDAAAARIAGVERTRSDLLESLAIMDDDRQRLADDLDAALARSRALESATTDAERTVETAVRRLDAILGEDKG